MSLNGSSSSHHESDGLTYFNDFEARTIEAIAERLIPGEGPDAGASEAGVMYYIDRTVAGFSPLLQRVYRLGLRELAAYCAQTYAAAFVDLDAEQQDAVVERWLGPPTGTPRTTFPPNADGQIDSRLLQRFFAVIREHAVEGYFCDPAYGGNRNAVGWRLVGFPGAYWGFTAAQMKPGFDGRSLAVKTLADLRAEIQRSALPPNDHFTSDGEA